MIITMTMIIIISEHIYTSACSAWFGHIHMPLGTVVSGGLRQSMWNANGQKSQWTSWLVSSLLQNNRKKKESFLLAWCFLSFTSQLTEMLVKNRSMINEHITWHSAIKKLINFLFFQQTCPYTETMMLIQTCVTKFIIETNFMWKNMSLPATCKTKTPRWDASFFLLTMSANQGRNKNPW